MRHNDKKPWPGTQEGGGCPECGAIRNDWDLEFHCARIGRFGVEWVASPGQGMLVALTCPACKTEFKTLDLPD